MLQWLTFHTVSMLLTTSVLRTVHFVFKAKHSLESSNWLRAELIVLNSNLVGVLLAHQLNRQKMDTVCIACAFLVILAKRFILNTASYMETRYCGIGNVVLLYGNQVLMDISLQSRHVRISFYRSTHLPPSRSGWQLPWLFLTSLHLAACSTWLA